MDCPTDWEKLQRPGFSPDFLDPDTRLGVTDSLAVKLSDWIPDARGQAILRYNRPLLAYLAGKPARFTSRDHNFLPGETAEKQIIIINDSRRPVECACAWKLSLPQPLANKETAKVDPGEQIRIPLKLNLSIGTPPGSYRLEMP